MVINVRNKLTIWITETTYTLNKIRVCHATSSEAPTVSFILVGDLAATQRAAE
jgi:hypothetical protein